MMMASLCSLSSWDAAWAFGGTPEIGFFRNGPEGLEYVGQGWSVRSTPDVGWTSMKVGTEEFLEGMVMKKGAQFAARFPDRQNLSHDELVGRIGAVSDGINMIRITPARDTPGAELYVGANEKETQDLLFIPADGVTVTNRSPREVVLSRGRTAWIEIRSGKEAADLHVGPQTFPDGRVKVVVALPCKGFAANAFELAFPGPTNHQEWAGDFVRGARFDVHSSSDVTGKDNRFGGAAEGVLNPIYGPDTKLDFGMTFRWEGGQPFSGRAELEVVHSLGQPHYSETVRLSAVTNGNVRITFHPKFHIPGVSEVWCRLIDSSDRLIWVNRYRMAYDWEHYCPKIQVEPDFKSFWDKTLADLRAIPLEPVTEAVDAFKGHPGFGVYHVVFNGWEKKRIHAMLFVPKGLKLPAAAVVTAHPAATGYGVNRRADGVYGSEIKQRTNVVTIVPLIRGHAPDAADIPFNHPWWGPLEQRDTFVARSWYCAMVRAVDYLETRPDLVDMKRVIALGGSQGGALALVTAGLDPRIRVCIADCPANCQPQEIMENYPSFGPSRGQIPAGSTLADTERLLSYYNPVNFCPSIKCPAYVGSNIGDLTVHSMGPLAAFHNLTGLHSGQKAFYPGFSHFHGSGPGLAAKTREIVDELAGKTGGHE